MPKKDRKKQKTAKEIIESQELINEEIQATELNDDTNKLDNKNSDSNENTDNNQTPEQNDVTDNKSTANKTKMLDESVIDNQSSEQVQDNQISDVEFSTISETADTLNTNTDDQKPSKASGIFAIIAGFLLILAGWSVYKYFTNSSPQQGDILTQEELVQDIQSDESGILVLELENESSETESLPTSDENQSQQSDSQNLDQTNNEDTQNTETNTNTSEDTVNSIKNFFNNISEKVRAFFISRSSETTEDDQIANIEINNENEVSNNQDQEGKIINQDNYEPTANENGIIFKEENQINKSESNNVIKNNSTTQSEWQANDYVFGDITGDTHNVVRGDTLWEISEAVYGSGTHWQKIADANNVDYLSNGNPLIIPGQTLTLPNI